jgi:hypothetical protein
MHFQRPTPDQVRIGLGALKYLALCDSLELDPSERGMIDAVQRVLETHHDVERLPAMSPADVARAIADPKIRHQIVCALIVMSLIDGEATEEEANLVDAFAFALGVDERAVENLRQLTRHENMALRFDVMRRFWAVDKLRERVKEEGIGAVVRFAKSAAGRHVDPDLVRRFAALRNLPDGTLGREYVRFLDSRGWPLPGEKGSASDIIVFHDMSHVLGEYDTDPIGEVEVACFSAGYRRQEPFTFILFVLLQFHVGVRVTPIAKSERGVFDVEKALRALARGAAMNTDLTSDWSYWDVVDVPLAELRERLGIPPKSTSRAA